LFCYASEESVFLALVRRDFVVFVLEAVEAFGVPLAVGLRVTAFLVVVTVEGCVAVVSASASVTTGFASRKALAACSGVATSVVDTGAAGVAVATSGVAVIFVVFVVVGEVVVVLLTPKIFARTLCFCGAAIALLFFPMISSPSVGAFINSNLFQKTKNLKNLAAVIFGGSVFSKKTPQPKREGGKSIHYLGFNYLLKQ